MKTLNRKEGLYKNLEKLNRKKNEKDQNKIISDIEKAMDMLNIEKNQNFLNLDQTKILKWI